MLLRKDYIIGQIVRKALEFEPDWSHIDDAINQIIKEHQIHQFNYSNRIAPLKGRIVVPTGGGKTAIQKGAIEYIMKLDGKNVHVVVAPRLGLSNQLAVEYRRTIGVNYIALSFHSGRHEVDYEKVAWKETNTTNVEKVESEIERAKRLGVDLVIFTTYHSLYRLLDIEFDSAFFDESQYCVGKEWFGSVKMLKADVKLFFTATEKIIANKENIDSNTRALNNEDVFGGIIYSILPKTLIARGCIVPPRLHIWSATRGGEWTLTPYIIDTVKFQHKHFMELGMPFTKTLVCANGTNDVKNVTENVKRIKKELPDHTIYTIISDGKYGAQIDGVKVARNEFFRRLKEPGNAIVVHYDIISEGIDIPGFTGVVLDRFLEKAKFLQSIGRALRVFKDAPDKKPYAIVTCPIWNGDKEMYNWASDLIRTLKAGGFDIMQEDILYTGTESGGGGEEEDEDKKYTMVNKIFDIVHRFEDEDEFNVMKKESVENLIARMPTFR